MATKKSLTTSARKVSLHARKHVPGNSNDVFSIMVLRVYYNMSMQGVVYLWRRDLAMMLAMVLAGGVGDVRGGRLSEI